MRSQIVFAWILEFITNCIRLELIEGIGRRALASVDRKVSLFADDFFWSPLTLVISAGISDSKWLRE